MSVLNRADSLGVDLSYFRRPGLSLSMVQSYGPAVMEDLRENGFKAVAKAP